MILNSDIELELEKIFKKNASEYLIMNNGNIHKISMKNSFFTVNNNLTINGINIYVIEKPDSTNLFIQNSGTLGFEGLSSSSPLIIDGGFSDSIILDDTLIIIKDGAKFYLENVKVQNIEIDNYVDTYVLNVNYTLEKDSNSLTTLTLGEGVIFDTDSIRIDKSRRLGLILLSFSSSQIHDSNEESKKSTIKRKITPAIPKSFYNDDHQIYCNVEPSYSSFDLFTYPSEFFVGGDGPNDEDDCTEVSPCLSFSHIESLIDISVDYVSIIVLGNSFNLSTNYRFSGRINNIRGTYYTSSVVVVNETSAYLYIDMKFTISDLTFSFSAIPTRCFITVYSHSLSLEFVIYSPVSLTSSLISLSTYSYSNLYINSVSFCANEEISIGVPLIVVQNQSSASFTSFHVENVTNTQTNGKGAAISATVYSKYRVYFTNCIFRNVKTSGTSSQGGAIYIFVSDNIPFGTIDKETVFEGCEVYNNNGNNIFFKCSLEDYLKNSAIILKNSKLLVDKEKDVNKF